MIRFLRDLTTTRDYKKTFFLLLLTWLLANLVQAIFMEITSDEAYYGMYSRYLDWGYYDHPPLIALLIKVSSWIFDGNAGIRFMTVVLQIFTILIIWKITDIENPESENVFTFFIIAAAISLFSAYGVITAPDSPLLFFTALFLLALKKYYEEKKWHTLLLLSLSMAGLVYSKYQGAFVIGLVILSNVKILKDFRFWIAGIFALLLLSPHIYWQIANDFPSFQYHIVDRSEAFRWVFFLEYLPNQMAVFNPLVLGAVGYIFVKYRPAGKTERAYFFLIAGFIGFFWLISFRGHVEPHWTVACSVPMIILLTQKIKNDKVLFRYSRKYILPSIILLLLIRLFLITDTRANKYLGFSGKEEKYLEIEKIARNLPVVFTGSFQKPSLYTFFTGKEATVISSLDSRQTQFDIWQFEKSFHNKPVFISTEAKGLSEEYGTGRLKFSGFRADSLQTVNRMKIKFDIEGNSYNTGDSVNITLTLTNTYNQSIDFNHPVFPVSFCMVLLKNEDLFVQDATLADNIGIIPGGGVAENRFISVIPDIPSGEYYLGVSLYNLFGLALNSHFLKIKIITDDR